MGKFFETVPENLAKWVLEQKLFWVATAPLSSTGHVNVSPKGGADFGLLDDKTFWYMDFTGSGNETISHLYEPDNGRITVMFNAFDGPPRIVRFFGHGRVLERRGHVAGDGRAFDEFVKKHDVPVIDSSRSIIIVDIHQVNSSCGYNVPYYEFKSFRTALHSTFSARAEKYNNGVEKEARERYWAFKNAYSLDGLPGMQVGFEVGKKEHIAPIEKMVGPMAQRRYHRDRRFSVWHLLFVAALSAVLTAFWPVLFALLREHIPA
ncbi:uncharacterized protein C8A04DRAFT_15732 [Dichotomopilus funicola]|uniref:Pyridoxamine 5'-phosphate oxidase N-terminal domain-containing protein n=1 Tax=Dichotomopilus funicola TaxID=1934379 RepID=A0AAN6ZIF1_9PEZI|nr:hypothetical protein C8A04DRAFT_15732 [Dichotomopilus funicola]